MGSELTKIQNHMKNGFTDQQYAQQQFVQQQYAQHQQQQQQQQQQQYQQFQQPFQGYMQQQGPSQQQQPQQPPPPPQQQFPQMPFSQSYMNNLVKSMHLSVSNPHISNAQQQQQQQQQQQPLQTVTNQTQLPPNKSFLNLNPLFSYQSSQYYTLPNGVPNVVEDQPDLILRRSSSSLIRPVSESNMLRKKTSGIENKAPRPINRQKLFVIRHGERVDTTFGPGWVENSFDNLGRYNRFNLNMPKNLPPRENPKYDYSFDPPLTEMGLHQAKLTGEELAINGINVKYCYCSPALRCIQTADKILEGMELKDKIQIRVEVGLYEYLRWQNTIPSKYPFMDLRSLVASGYNVDLNYKPVVPYEMLRFDETEDIYYQRSFYLTRVITDRHQEGNIMFVAHAPSIEVCTRQLCGEEPRVNDFRNIVRKVPFLAIAQCEKHPISHKWKLKKPPIPPIRHLSVDEFDWKNLQHNGRNEQQQQPPPPPPPQFLPPQFQPRPVFWH